MKHNPDVNKNPGRLLRRLLDLKPTGRHVNHVRLCLAQLMSHDTERFTGITQDVEAAKEEFFWLANNVGYAPAQFALANLHDPTCARTGDFIDGPLPIHLMIPSRRSPFQPNKKLAMEYYERACNQKLSCALCVVGTYCKNGDGIVYQRDLSRGISLLHEAANMDHTKALANLGRYYITVGNENEALNLFVKAAEFGNYMSMFIICQYGLIEKKYEVMGKKWIVDLIDAGWSSDEPGGDDAFIRVASGYGLNFSRR